VSDESRDPTRLTGSTGKHTAEVLRHRRLGHRDLCQLEHLATESGGTLLPELAAAGFRWHKAGAIETSPVFRPIRVPSSQECLPSLGPPYCRVARDRSLDHLAAGTASGAARSTPPRIPAYAPPELNSSAGTIATCRAAYIEGATRSPKTASNGALE
jgi:hypothetical protein